MMKLDPVLVSPFKWAGGKRWLANRHRDLLPSTFRHYFEPFLGGASVFLSLRPKDATLSDANRDLIAVYEALRDDWERVIEYLGEHSRRHGQKYYYDLRENAPTGKYKRAAWFLYMNRACYNGLYRVNLKGKFNVPKGTKDNIFLSTDNFKEISNSLRNVDLLHSDFERVIDMAREGDLIYADPPYTVKHNNNGFIKYNEQLFSWADQERLAKAVARASKRGVMAAVSNADHESIIDLYRSVGRVQKLSRHSTIGGRLASRAGTTEVLIAVGY